MKRLAAIAVVVALVALPLGAQRGGSHGGFSGGHAGGGISAPRGGFSGGHISPPSFHGGPIHSGSGSFVRSGPPRFGGAPGGFHGFNPPGFRPPARFAGPVGVPVSHPPQYISGRMPYRGRGLRPVAPIAAPPRQPVSGGSSHRMQYHSPYGGDQRGIADHRGGGGDHHGGWDHHGHDHDHWHVYYGFYGPYAWVGYPYWPWWGWGYPYLPTYWNSGDDYDSQPASNYAASQYPEYQPSPYVEQPDEQPPDQPEPDQPSPTPWPYSRPAPPISERPPALAAPSESPATTLVFKDGRPNERIHNYLLTATTLSVLDQQRRDIPVNQIDLAATARVNREAGVEFALPVH